MVLPIRLSKDSREPIYHQIENQIKALIAGGHLPANTSLPSIRVLAKELETSVITIRRAYQDLENEGFIRTTQGKGTFVAEIDSSLKQQVKTTSVYQTMEKAIETARSYDYTYSQIEELFHKTINDYKRREE